MCLREFEVPRKGFGMSFPVPGGCDLKGGLEEGRRRRLSALALKASANTNQAECEKRPYGRGCEGINKFESELLLYLFMAG